jgi:hypothetical protein
MALSILLDENIDAKGLKKMMEIREKPDLV